jgi:hypothetical protein
MSNFSDEKCILICFELYFDRFTENWKEVLDYFFKQRIMPLKIKPTHLEITLKKGKTGVASSKDILSKTLKYTEKKMQNYIQRKDVISLSILSDSPPANTLFSAEFQLKASMLEINIGPFCRLYLHMEYSRFKALYGIDFKSGFINLINEFAGIGHPRYGFLQPMENTKVPYLFFTGITPEGKLTEEEEKKCEHWQDHNKEFSNRVRDVYYGNLLSEEHCRKVLPIVDSLKLLVKNENVINRTKDSLIFFLPVNAEQAIKNSPEMQTFSTQISDLFRKNDLLLSEM